MSFPRYPAYKDSGVDWLGEVPEHWEVRPFKGVIERNDGGVWGDDPTGDGDTLVLRSTEQTVDGRWQLDDPAHRSLSSNDKSAALLEAGDLLVTKSSGSSLHIGKTTLVTTEIASLKCCYSNFMQRIRVSPAFSPRLAWYVMNNELARRQFDFLSNSTTGLANLNGTMIGQIITPIPTFEEQAAIATFLDRETAKIDALVAEQERLIALLKEKRQAVISHAVTKGLDPSVPMKDSGVEWLGEVPAHWEVVRIKHVVASIEQGWSPQCESYPVESADQWGVLKVGCVNGGVFNPDENKVLPDDLTPVPALAIRAGDVLVSRANTRELVGSAATALMDYPNLLLCDKLYRLRLNHKMNAPQYLAYFLGCLPVREQIELAATGASSSMLNIGQATILELRLPHPDVEEQLAITAHLDAVTARMRDTATEAEAIIAALQERRSALISAAVTGQIDVRGAPEQAP